ncbi:DUF1254 domain-containing protein [Rubellimicrobium roseum]|uniref:DUF1254 domain-containing protein n=1 Tax=Rubellimicrobium roseum TaxID=687525 RepID=A0A5C4N6L2_9RHOB|nr:DUF1254 domain-containing protein [Rubellimicrobium roseum]TNC66566.1 DUF1254 domain-containing protein [Rubellimicrobium roseum]
MNRRTFLLASVAMTALASSVRAQSMTAEEAGEIAHEAYIYTFPMVENYLSIHQYALDPAGSQYKAPINAIGNVDRVFTPEDTGVVTPNSDTPYSFLIMDLRAEPMVVTLPPIEDGRYYSLHLVDLYSHNVDFLGTRKDGNDGGDFLIAGPDWEGEAPEGIRRVVRIPTRIMYSMFRTQLFNPADIERVRAIQAGYAVRPLSEYAGTEAPAPAPSVDWPPINRETAQTEFWSFANFLLQFAPPLEWEKEMQARFAQVGVAPAATWPAAPLAPEIEAAVIEAGDAAFAELNEELLSITSSKGLFGTPEEMRGNYVGRALGALGGLYGLSPEEALYFSFLVDGEGQRLDTGRNNYALRFGPGGLPPVGAFWSVTMYDGNRFLVDNALDRYLINSPMLPNLQANDTGEIVIYLQHESPGPDLESNWLPAPDGPMAAVMRLYLPKPEALDGSWQPPAIETMEKPR